MSSPPDSGFISRETALKMLEGPIPEGHTAASYFQVIADWLNPPQAEEDPAEAERERLLVEFEKLAAEFDADHGEPTPGHTVAADIREIIAKLRTGRD